MHVLVTGATGFVGLHTALALQKAGHSVRLGARNKDKLERICAEHGITPSDCHIADIVNDHTMDKALEGCDGVVHTAALVSMNPAEASRMRKTNVQGTQSVLGHAVKRGIRSLVYVSSAAALFEPGRNSIDEDTPLANARSPYAASKAEADHFVRSLVADGANIATTYPTGIIGPWDPGASEGNRGLEFILNAFHIHTSSGVQVIDVRDLAAIHVRLLEEQRRGPYICAGHYSSWKEFGQTIEQATSHRLWKIPVPGPAMRAIGTATDAVPALKPSQLPMSREAMELATRWALCNDNKLHRELGVNYRPLQETVKDTVQWMAQTGRVKRKWTASIRD